MNKVSVFFLFLFGCSTTKSVQVESLVTTMDSCSVEVSSTLEYKEPIFNKPEGIENDIRTALKTSGARAPLSYIVKNTNLFEVETMIWISDHRPNVIILDYDINKVIYNNHCLR